MMMMMNNDKFAVPPESELQIAVCLYLSPSSSSSPLVTKFVRDFEYSPSLL